MYIWGFLSGLVKIRCEEIEVKFFFIIWLVVEKLKFCIGLCRIFFFESEIFLVLKYGIEEVVI